jgi:DNA (cytosine-5)-methyltransferase 1
MTITYGSVCSGIEAATQAWHPLGMRAAWFAEIEPSPRYCIIPLGKRAFST